MFFEVNVLLHSICNRPTVFVFFSALGMDTQVVMRPLLDKIEVKTTATAIRKIHFPHVSGNSFLLARSWTWPALC